MLSFSPLRNVVSHTLPNGLKVLLKEDHAWPVLSLHVWVRVGSVDEWPAQAGISHIVEHMVFKGTTGFRGAEISRWVESLGGAINAETSKEYTHYHIDVPQAGGQKAIALLGELAHQALFDPKEWDRERLVILEEIKRRNDDPEAMLWDLLNEALFREERLRRSVIGSVETVGAITRDQLWHFYQDAYRAGRCVVVIAGDFNSKRMLGWVDKAFGRMPAGKGTPRPPAAAGFPAAQHLRLKRPVQQSYVALGLPTPPSESPDHEALDVLAAALGEGRSSRLVDTLRETKKIVWSISAVNYGHDGPGIFSIFAECEPHKRKQLRPEIERIFAGLRRRPLTAKELSRTKNIIENTWLQGFETYHQQASTLGHFALDGQLDRLENYLPKINRLTLGALADVAERYLHRLPLSTAVIEP